MERSEKCSPSTTASPSVSKSSKTQFLTPCRRLGLARKSPATAGSCHTNKSSQDTVLSHYKSPLQSTPKRDSNAHHLEGDSIRNQVTPSRNHKRVFYKRFKCSNALTSQMCNEGGQNNILACNKDHPSINKSPGDTETVEKGENSVHDGTSSYEEIIYPTEEITKEMIEEAKSRIKNKEEQLEELNRSQIYKKKHNVETLQKLIQKWNEGCQAALLELQSVLLAQGHQINMEELLKQLSIPHELVKYRVDLDDFE